MKKLISLTLLTLLISTSVLEAADTDDMIWIDSGTFWMGSDHHLLHEYPAHQVTVDGFWIDKNSVTNKQYTNFVEASNLLTRSEFLLKTKDYSDVLPEKLDPASSILKKPEGNAGIRSYYNWLEFKPGATWRHPEGSDSNIDGREHHPVVHVTYKEAKHYCRWRHKDIPTEAQYEYAASGGLNKKVDGQGDRPKHLNEERVKYWQDGYLFTSPVGSSPVNEYGLYDMTGNVWEWVSDWYHPRYYETSPKENPTGAIKEHSIDPNEPSIPKRIVKGGSSLCSVERCTGYRPSAKIAADPQSGSNHIGFRCVINQRQALSKH